VAVVYNPLLANIVGGNSFSMQGGSVQVHGQFWHGLGVVADVSGLHTASTGGSSGVGLDMVTATFGPRYTWSPAHRRYAIFGQALVGEAHGMNSVFPNPAGANDSANSLALYVGGGINVRLKDHLALRVLEADWLRTQLPNATTNVQNNLRVGAGLIYRFK
jgi:peptidoglycan-associated lipoprotein